MRNELYNSRKKTKTSKNTTASRRKNPIPVFVVLLYGLFSCFLLLPLAAADTGTYFQWSDRQTMEYLYEKTKGETWKDNTNWRNGAKSVCEWEGITCVEGAGEKVSAIDLHNNNLDGTIPMDRILDMDGLTSLKLGGNQVDISMDNGAPATITSATLKVLDLSDANVNSLDGIKYAIVGLTHLNLSRNRLRGKIPNELTKVSSMQQLKLEFNGLTGTLPSEIGTLRKLVHFSVNNNELEGSLPEEIGELTRLRVLSLQGNKFSGDIPAKLQDIVLLENLNLSNNAFSGRLPPFDNLERIRRIDVSKNSLTGNVPSSLLQNANPAEFEFGVFSSNKLRGILPGSLKLLNPADLFFEDNMITGIDEALCKLESDCDQILCAKGKFRADVGRREDADSDCEPCPSAQYFGSIDCDPNAVVPTNAPIPSNEGFVPSPVIALDMSERDILVQLYYDCGGDHWHKNTNWNDDGDVCMWEGITCDSSGSGVVTSISLGNNNLVGLLPKEVFSLPYLENLFLDDNSILFHFEGIGNAKKLRSLDLSNTGLFSIEHIEEAASLSVLTLASNELENEIPDEISMLKNLVDLNLDYNAFSGEIPNMFDKFPLLKTFSVAENDLSGEIPTSLASCMDLSILRLQGNKLQGPLPSWINDLPMLSVFEVASQGFVGDVPSLHRQPHLTRVDLSHNSFAGELPLNFLAKVDPDTFDFAGLSSNRISGVVRWTPLLGSIIEKVFLEDNFITELEADFCVSGKLDSPINKFGCDAILCPPQTYHALGRQESMDSCQCCTDATYMGTTECDDLSTEGCTTETENPTPSPSRTPTIRPHPDAPPTSKRPTSSPTQSPTEMKDVPPDQAILELIYMSCNGPSWTESTNWLTELSICNWAGIRCKDGVDRRVSSIILKSNNLQCELPGRIFDLEHMETLVLDGNAVSFDFEDIELATSLKILDLSHTDLNSLSGIQRAESLTDLHLASTKLDGNFPDELLSLTGLERLALDFNDFTGTLPAQIGDLKKLEYFSAHNNKFTGLIPESIGQLDSLLFLLLQDNSFEGAIPDDLSLLTNLWFIDISHQLSSSDPSDEGLTGDLPSFAGFQELRRLDLSHNGLDGTVPSNFLADADPGKFEYADLSFNFLKGTLPQGLSRLPALSFFFEQNEISSIDQALCSTSLGGAIAAFGCDAILCDKGTYNAMGKKVSSTTDCEPCAGAVFFGATACDATNAPTLPPINLPPPDNDRRTLELLYDSCGGPNWFQKNQWKQDSTSICDWYGIRCVEGTEYVEFILLSSNNLVGTPPQEIFDLQYLDTLQLDSNYISFDFSNIGKSRKLTTLDLSATGISDLSGIGAAKTLTDLHLASNQLKGSIPEELYQLSNLEQFSLDFNGFEGKITHTIQNLKNLKLLSIAANSLTGEIPEAMGDLDNLLTLRLQFNSFSGKLPGFFEGDGKMKGLTLLDLSSQNSNLGTGFTGALPSFAAFSGLRRVDLSGNSFTGVIPDRFLYNVNPLTFEFADLSGNKLSGKVPSELAPIIHMVYLEENEITAIDPSLCDSNLGGYIADFGCDAVLCPPNKYNPLGRQDGIDSPCMDCVGAKYFGTVDCDLPGPGDSNNNKPVAPVEDREREILNLFYDSCGGYYWRSSKGWKTANNVCEWEGIKCNSVGRVEAIKLGSNNVVGTPPPDIFMLTALSILSLYSNPLDFSFEGIASAESLQYLYLDATGLESMNGIGKAPSLVEVHMRFNALRGPIPEEIADIETLKLLSVSNNAIETPWPDRIIELPNLETLLVASNRIRANLNEIGIPMNLKTLDLSNNELTGTIPHDFLATIVPSSGVEVDLSENMLTGVVPPDFSRFEDFGLFLRDNNLKGIAPELCGKKSWNEGDVGKYGCDAILCPAGQSSPNGRQTNAVEPCRPCPTALYYGDSQCHLDDSSAASWKQKTGLATAYISTVLFVLTLAM